MVKLSVVIPHLNYGRFLAQCLDSVITQTHPPDEIILVDGGSTDETWEILRHYPTVKVVKEPFHSHLIPHAINLGLLESHGDYVQVTNSDCWLERTFFEETIPQLERDSRVGLVYSNWNYVDESGGIISTFRAPPYFDRQKLLKGNYIDLMCGVWKKEAGFFDESLAYHYDWLMWIRLSKKFEVVPIQKPLVKFRIHNQQRAKDAEYVIDFKLAQVKIDREEGIDIQKKVLEKLSYYRRLRTAARVLVKGR